MQNRLGNCVWQYSREEKGVLASKITKISQQNLFDVILESQKAFLDYKKQKFQKVEKSGFFQRG